LELLVIYLEQSPTVSMMNVLTYRPDFVPSWSMHSHMIPITLNRLERPEVEALIGHQASGKQVPPAVVEHIVAKSDGVPLYVEELTKSILESDYLHDEGERYTLAGSLSEVAIPATLQDSLMARLDRRPTLRKVAQMGSVLGREFAYEMLRAVVGLEEPQLQSSLEQLVADELLYQRGRLPRSKYIFKHALIQDAAYQSLLKSTRQQHHERVARVLEERFPETAESQPELLAHHYSEAQLHNQAIHYWHQAGQRASECSANLEAIAHLTRGLELIKTLPDTPERARQELGLCLTLGPALMAIKGWAVPEVAQVYVRARVLCRQVGETSQRFAATWGLWIYYLQGAQLNKARGLAEEVLTLAERQNDSALRLQAHHAAWATFYRLAEFSACGQHAEQGIALYNFDKHRTHAYLYGGHDPGVCAYLHAAAGQWVLGYPDQAVEKAQDAMTLGQQLLHPFSLIEAVWGGARVHQFRREAYLVREPAEVIVALSTEHGFPHCGAWGAVIRGWTLAAEGQAKEGIAEMRQGLDVMRAIGAQTHVPYFIALLAEGYAQTGQADEGLNALAEALNLVEKTGERTWEAEIHRLKGELLLVRSAKKQAEAEACFNQAVEIARKQSAKSLELRAVTSLSRLWHDQGKQAEARDLLAPVYGWFTEGFDTSDLKDAKALLDSLP
jgi:predicted ATPase